MLNGEKMGLLVESASIEQTYEAMRFFLEIDKSSYQKFSKSARKLAKKRFGIQKQLQKHYTLYKNILEVDKMISKIYKELEKINEK